MYIPKPSYEKFQGSVEGNIILQEVSSQRSQYAANFIVLKWIPLPVAIRPWLIAQAHKRGLA